jgi:hypothetical protein
MVTCSQLDRLVFLIDETPAGGISVKRLDLYAM